MSDAKPSPDQPTALTREQVDAGLADLKDWQLSDDGTRIQRTYRMKNFLHALRFFDRIAEVAEAENHHPDLHLTGYRNVVIELWTHTLGGVSENDIKMAATIDTVPVAD